MNVMFLHSGVDVPAARFRMLPFGRRLRQAGHRCTLAGSFPQKYEHFPAIGFRASQKLKQIVRAKHLAELSLRRFDVVVIERELFDNDSHAWEDRFRKVAKTIVLDVDDGIFLRYPQKYEHLARIADGVIAGNPAIADYTAPFNEYVTVIPTCIDLDDYPVSAPPVDNDDRVPVVGWIGTKSNLPFLEVCAPALRRLAERRSFELRIVCSELTPLESVNLDGVDVRFVEWDARTAVDELMQFHVGIMPLPADQPWTKYKCGLKLLQYMAAGKPGVASPVGVNSEIVDDGCNGFLAANADEWESRLDQLLDDGDLRQQLGRAARLTVEQKYSLDVHFPRFVTALEEAIQRSQS